MESMDGIVKANLQQQVNILDTRLKAMFVGLRIGLLILILLTEVVPYFQHYRMLDKWHSVNPLIRFSSYAALLLFQYFIGGMIIRKKFGDHIAYLKTLIKEMQ
jgi:hypothetical protein